MSSVCVDDGDWFLKVLLSFQLFCLIRHLKPISVNSLLLDSTLSAYRPITLFMAVPTVYAKMIEAARNGTVDEKVGGFYIFIIIFMLFSGGECV